MKFWLIIIFEHIKSKRSGNTIKPERFFAIAYRTKNSLWGERWKFVRAARREAIEKK